MAIVDTTLPVGGGPTGKSPIFVPTGTNIAFHVTALHRRKDLWGEDAEDFRPERWEKIQGQGAWIYQPFGGGPRNCPGQHLSLAEAAYTTTRIVQEFTVVSSRDDEPWTELIALTCTNANGAKVTLTEA
jgi:cytochrome P450